MSDIVKFPVSPARDWLIVDMEESKYKGSLIIPDSAKDAPQHGVVIAAGPGLFAMTEQGDPYCTHPMNSSVGDRVMFLKYAGADFEWKGKKYLLVRDSDIAAYFLEDPNA